jgi:hypothetical protein
MFGLFASPEGIAVAVEIKLDLRHDRELADRQGPVEA